MTLPMLFLLIKHLSTWQRSLLMTAVMQQPMEPLSAAFEEHMLDTREGMAGATPAGGIPCGCN